MQETEQGQSSEEIVDPVQPDALEEPEDDKDELIRIVLREEEFDLLTDEFWYLQDEEKTKKLDEQDFLMVVIDVLAEISSKYAISEDQMSLQNQIIDKHFGDLFQRYQEDGIITKDSFYEFMNDFLDLHNKQSMSDLKFEKKPELFIEGSSVQANMTKIDDLYKQLKEKEEQLEEFQQLQA